MNLLGACGKTPGALVYYMIYKEYCMQKVRMLILLSLFMPVLAFAHEHRTDMGCSVKRLCEFPAKIKEEGVYVVNKEVHYSKSCAAITIESDNVELVFCEEGSIELSGEGTGILIKADHVTVVGPQIKTNSEEAVAISLCSGVRDWTIEQGDFEGFSVAIESSDFEDGTLKDTNFYNCIEGFKQKNFGVAKRLLIKNIRADSSEVVSENSIESYTVSLEGEVIDSVFENAQFVSTSFYCFKCRNSVAEDVQVFYPSIVTPFLTGVQFGGPRGIQLLAFNFDNPIPDELRQGCINCRTSNVQATMINDSGQVLFPIGISTMFCENCEIVDCQSTVLADPNLIDGVCFFETYCKSCTISRCIAEGATATGIFICDPVDQCLFCEGTRVLNCTARNCWLGISVYRCHAPVVDSCDVHLCVTGVSISEGATNAIVSNCRIAENSLVGLAYVPLSAPNIGTIFPPTFTPDPCPANIQDPKNGVVTGTTFAGNATNIIDQVGSLNIGVNNNFF